MPILENADPLEARLDPDTGLRMGSAQNDTAHADKPNATGFVDAELLSFLADTKRLSRSYQTTAVLASWEASHAAYRSQHPAGSKYSKDQYKNRAKYFKPKTRSAVRKNLTATANALFSSQDVMSVSAQDDGNPIQLANAALVKELINSRFTSKAPKNGVPWFQIAIGARFDTQVTGVVCSKQTWNYKAKKRTKATQTEQPIPDAYGQPMIDQATGQPMVQVVQGTEETTDVIFDKPEITLIPGEMVLLDPSAPWINPAQSSPTLIVVWPMHVDDVKAMMAEDKNSTPWRDIPDATLAASYYSETEVLGIKQARDGSAQPIRQHSSGAFGGSRSEIVEVWECMFRRDDTEYHCWSLKGQALLSDAVAIEEVYPAHRGARPYVIGSDALEPHVLYPESHVASWKHSQDEINDFSNLRMDASRQAVFPVAKVKAGKNIDYKAVQRRDGQGIILVREPDDVTWDRPPGPPPNVHEEVNLLSNDFDELAGIFSQGSVQSNRQIGDTVGGMQLISANANATSEFDLRCFLDTWAEPVLSQIVSLIQYYEDDATLIAVAGEKAKLFQKFQIDAVTDEMLESQISIEINVGIGNSDPMQQLAKFKTVFEIAAPIIQMAKQEGKAELQYEEIFSEIFGKAGYRNGGARFIKMNPEGKPAIPPEAVDQLKKALEQAQQQIQQLTGQVKSKAGEIQSNQQIKAAELASQHESRQAELKQTGDNQMHIAMLGFLKDTIIKRMELGTDTDSSMLDAKIEAILGLMQQGADIHVAGLPEAPPAGASSPPVPQPTQAPPQPPAPPPMAAPMPAGPVPPQMGA